MAAIAWICRQQQQQQRRQQQYLRVMTMHARSTLWLQPILHGCHRLDLQATSAAASAAAAATAELVSHDHACTLFVLQLPCSRATT
jgi:uncharacterized membrane protein